VIPLEAAQVERAEAADTDVDVVLDEAGTLLDCGPALRRLLGADPSAPMIGLPLAAFSPDAPALQRLLAQARLEGRAGPADIRLAKTDGALIDMQCSVVARYERPGDPPVLVGRLVDVAERRRLEQQLIGTQRLEVIGRLAGGLAHDFNNLLTIIAGNADTLLCGLSEGDPLRQAAEDVMDAASRAASITRQLLAFGRKQVSAPEPLLLQDLVAESAPLLTGVLGARVQLQLDLSDAAPEVHVDRGLFEQVIINLALNARDAMPAGGRLSIHVDAVDVNDRTRLERPWLRPGSYVRVRVSDTGHGMDPVTRAHVFEPFFTTRRNASNRGLGLAAVYGIVKQSNGFVWVESEPQAGATFTVLVPVRRHEAPGAGARPGGETVLVVEPDHRQRSRIRETLERRGYRVLTASSGADAVSLFAAHPTPVHLLVAARDAVTPAGHPLPERLQAIDPALQSLVVIDASEEPGTADAVLPTMPTIRRPFSLMLLADRVRSVLDSGEGRRRRA
jgi:two-component system, cell cycle sensor histidine kinase and response regulator CckA